MFPIVLFKYSLNNKTEVFYLLPPPPKIVLHLLPGILPLLVRGFIYLLSYKKT